MEANGAGPTRRRKGSIVSEISKLELQKKLGFEESEGNFELGDFESLAKGCSVIYKYNWLSLCFVDPDVHIRFVQCKSWLQPSLDL